MSHREKDPRFENRQEMHVQQASPEVVVQPYPIGEAADYSGFSIASLRRWSDAGKLPHFRTPGGQRRFLKEDLDGLRN